MLDRLAVLRRQPDQPGAMEELKPALTSKVSLAVGKAAKIAGEARLTDLIPDLLSAFDRLFANGFVSFEVATTVLFIFGPGEF